MAIFIGSDRHGAVDNEAAVQLGHRLPIADLAPILQQLPLGVALLEVGPVQIQLVYCNRVFRECIGLDLELPASTCPGWPIVPGVAIEQRLRAVWQTGESWRYVGPAKPAHQIPGAASNGLRKGMVVDLCYQLWRDEVEQPVGLLATSKAVQEALKPERPYLGDMAPESRPDDGTAICPVFNAHVGCAYQRKLDLCMAMLGHDLRNPLSAIQLSAHILRRHRNHGSSTALQRIMDSSTRMQRMVEQLLDFVRVRWHSGLPLSCSLIELADMVEQMAAEWRLSHPENAIAFSRSGKTQAWVDKDRICQMISNMLGNALQYSASSSKVVVWLDGQAAEHVVFGVQNQAYIEPERLQRLFEPFAHDKQVTSSGSSGLGLGLFIAEQVVLAHGGRIEVDSCPLKGTTTFQVFLPRYPAAATP